MSEWLKDQEAVVDAARKVDTAYGRVGHVVVAGATTNSEQWGEFHRAAQELHLALAKIPEPHIHEWSVIEAKDIWVKVMCAGHPVGERPEAWVRAKLPITLPTPEQLADNARVSYV